MENKRFMEHRKMMELLSQVPNTGEYFWVGVLPLLLAGACRYSWLMAADWVFAECLVSLCL